MPKKRFSAEQIVTLLRQIEVSLSQGKAAPIACRDAGIFTVSVGDTRAPRNGASIRRTRQERSYCISDL